jgi:hypothetical protein
MKMRMTGWAIAAVLVAGSPPALASACKQEIFVPIRFPPGSATWVHRGRGTHYFGFFKKDQSLSIAGAGGTNYDTSGDLSWAAHSDDPWQLTLEGPNGFLVSSSYDGTPLHVDKLPVTGKYVISMGPCVDWGEPGTLVVRASGPPPQ